MSYVSHDDVMNFINSISGIANRIFELEGIGIDAGAWYSEEYAGWVDIEWVIRNEEGGVINSLNRELSKNDIHEMTFSEMTTLAHWIVGMVSHLPYGINAI
jgi:hypothetical protein